MKAKSKLIIYSFILVFYASCTKDEPVLDVNQYELIANMETYTQTRTSLTGLQDGKYEILWGSGDEIGVFVDGAVTPEKFTLKSGEGTVMATFMGSSAGKDYCALYPFANTSRIENDLICFTLPEVQQYQMGSFGPGSYPMMAKSAGNILDFRNLCAIMKISITGEDFIRSITLQANDEKAYLSGAAGISSNYDSYPQLQMLDGASNAVKLECDGIKLTKDTVTDFHISIPPQTYKGGFEIIIDTYTDTVVKSVASDLEFKRSQIRHLKGMELQPTFYVSSDYSKNGTTVQLQKATEGNGINIVLMGDGYSDRLIADGTYKADMEYAYNSLFNKEPYKSYRHLFNVSYVNLVSATEGFEYNDTALDCKFGTGTHISGNDQEAFNYAQKVVDASEIDETLVVVVLNSDRDAGTCYMYYSNSFSGTDYGKGAAVAYFAKNDSAESFAEVLNHEANGHGFAKLADEYAYEYMGAIPSEEVENTRNMQSTYGWYKNVDFTNDPAQVRWKKFLEDTRYAKEGLGVFEGGLTYWSGVWRPTENSIMRYNTGEFNAPSREAIYYRIHKLAYGAEWQYDYEKFVEYDAVNYNAQAAPATRVSPLRPQRQLHPPVVVYGHWSEKAVN